MSINSDKLAKALSQLNFVSVVEHEQQSSAISVLCRIRPGSGILWASVAEKILREAVKRQGTQDYWHTHIARVYMIRNNLLVYGWTFVIMSSDQEKTINIVSEIIRQSAQETNKTKPSLKNSDDEDYEIDNREGLGEDDDYSEPDGPLPPGTIPEADEQGNPIVPRANRVHKIKMAGLPKNYDRNAPDEDKLKGSWQVETRKGQSFRPPIRVKRK